MEIHNNTWKLQHLRYSLVLIVITIVFQLSTHHHLWSFMSEWMNETNKTQFLPVFRSMMIQKMFTYGIIHKHYDAFPMASFIQCWILLHRYKVIATVGANFRYWIVFESAYDLLVKVIQKLKKFVKLPWALVISFSMLLRLLGRTFINAFSSYIISLM